MWARVGTCISVSTGKSCAMSLKRKHFPFYAANQSCTNGQKLSSNQWPIILGSWLWKTSRGEWVLIVIRFNATFLYLWGLRLKKYVPLSWTMQKVLQCMVRRFDAVKLFIFILILWTLQPHFTLRLSSQTLVRVCACQNTFAFYLDVVLVLYQMLHVSEQ